MIQVGDKVCFGERLGDFGEIPHKVIGVKQREEVYISKPLMVLIILQQVCLINVVSYCNNSVRKVGVI